MSDSSISNFTNKDAYSDIISDTSTGNKLLNVNGTGIALSNGKKTGSYFSKVQDSVSQFDKSVNINQYLAPTTLTLSTLDKMGSEIDKSIDSAFLLQMFHVKATDILCTVFCFLLSTLSCSQRNDLYNDLQSIVNVTQGLKTGINRLNQGLAAVGAVASSVENIQSSVGNIFNGNSSAKDAVSLASSAVTIAAAPVYILNSIKPILNLLRISKSFKFMMPDILGTNLWDLVRHVMFMAESQALQASDEALSKLIKPVEDILKDMTPSMCFGPAASRLQYNIILTIKKFKSKILEMLASLMVGDGNFNLNFQNFNLTSAFGLEMLAFAKVLEYISVHFFDVATACGISPCGKNSVPNADQYTVDNIGNLPSHVYKTSATSPNIVKGTPPIIANNIEDLATKLAPTLGQTVVTPTTIVSSYDLGSPPKKIIDSINGGILNNMLDDNFSIYINPENNNVKIVNNIQRNCGE